MKFLCVVGKKRSGKDTVADFIIAEHPLSTKYALAAPIKEALNYAYNCKNLHQKSGVELTREHFDGTDPLTGLEYDREKPINISNSDAIDLMQAAVKYLEQLVGLKQKRTLSSSINSQIDTLLWKTSDFWCVRRFMQVLGTDIVVNMIDTQFWNRCMINEFLDSDSKDIPYFIISDIRQEHEIQLMRDLGATIIFVEREDSINKNRIDDHITEQGLISCEGDIVIKNSGSLSDLKHKILEVI